MSKGTSHCASHSEIMNDETSTGSVGNVSGSATQVRNGKVSKDDASCSVNGVGCPRTGMAIVPVKVKRKGSETAIITYIFLDSGSSSTFCTESLMKQLSIDGLKTRIALTTLEKKGSLVESYLVRDLIISDLVENNFIALPVLYTRTEIQRTIFKPRKMLICGSTWAEFTCLMSVRRSACCQATSQWPTTHSRSKTVNMEVYVPQEPASAG